ncbi:MAG TPA: DUF4097 family beta strand repeat-containing protein [Gemmatimonadales bacterium]
MFPTLVSTVFSVMTLAAPIDTTVPAERGQRLEANVFGGEIIVKTWARNAVRLQADPSSRTEVTISSVGSTIIVRSEGRRGPASAVDLNLTVPVWMALDLSGVYTDVTIDGVRASLEVETVQGDVEVTGGEGQVSLSSVQGSVTLRGAKGRIGVHSVNEDVRVMNTTGEIKAETVNGEIELEKVDATNLDANTVNGDVAYDGPIHDGGRYALSSHNGDITIGMTPTTNATVAVSTFSGDFESDFPVTIKNQKKGKRFDFTLGRGGAQVELESFQGTIRLVRPGTAASRQDHDNDDDRDTHP